MKKAIIMLAEARPHVAIHPGRHATWYGRGDTSRHQALGILAALFGAVGVPGGLYFPTPVKKAHSECAECGEEPETPAESIQDDYYPFASMFGSPTSKIIEASLTGDPYPVKLWGINGVNILQTIPNPYHTMEAINKLDFIFCEEIMPTETAMWSDIVLPGATYLERFDAVYTYDLLTPYITVRQPMVEPMFETRTPYWIARQLAKRLGIDCFHCKDTREIVEEELKGAGLTLEALDNKGGLVPVKANPYRERKDLKFNTDSGKIALSVEDYADEDLDPVPRFIPTPAPPEGFARLIYGRVPVHTFTRTMNNSWLHNEWPENHLWLNDEAASKMGLKNGDEVVLENQDGKRSLPIKLKVTPGIRPDVVYMAHGYGSRSKMLTKAFEKGASDQFVITMYENDPFMGASSHRTNFVRIIKGGKAMNIPDLRPLPPQLPRFQMKKGDTVKTGGGK
jgi:thiosulfate reductase/polysulfide reductase chain A